MNKRTEQMEKISQAEVDCIIYTGKDFKHVTKLELVEALRKESEAAACANNRAEAYSAKNVELQRELKNANENARRENFTEVPTEEFNDVINDVKIVSEKLRKVVLDRVNGFEKRDLLMDCFQAVERVHSFCIGRANASSAVAEEY